MYVLKVPSGYLGHSERVRTNPHLASFVINRTGLMYSFTLCITPHAHLYISLTVLNEYGKYGKNMENLNVVLLTVFCVKHAARCKLELIITSDICVMTLIYLSLFVSFAFIVLRKTFRTNKSFGNCFPEWQRHKSSIKLSIKMVHCIA